MRFLKSCLYIWIYGKASVVRYKGRNKISPGLLLDILLRNHSKLYVTGVVIKKKYLFFYLSGPIYMLSHHNVEHHGEPIKPEGYVFQSDTLGNYLHVDDGRT